MAVECADHQHQPIAALSRKRQRFFFLVRLLSRFVPIAAGLRWHGSADRR